VQDVRVCCPMLMYLFINRSSPNLLILFIRTHYSEGMCGLRHYADHEVDHEDVDHEVIIGLIFSIRVEFRECG
jgi:hypothetical protein